MKLVPFKFFSILMWLPVAGLALATGSCRPIVEDPSPFATQSGQSTMILGSDCKEPFTLGYNYCPLRVAQPVPALELFFMNPADYAVSDCTLGIYKTGKAQPGSTSIDLSGLNEEIQKHRFCLLRIEAIERYPDPKDLSQLREIPLVGGFFIEVLDANYFPVPSDPVVSWCYKVSGTNKGRRVIEACP